MQKVLLIGGGGFVGSHLSDYLKHRGHTVFLADLPFVAQSHPNVYPLDLACIETIDHVLKEIHPDCIFHLAAQSMVSRSWTEPETTFDTNVLGSLKLYDSICRNVPNARFIYIGSGEEYGTNCSAPFKETDPTLPGNPYAVSKLCAGRTLELLSQKSHLNFVHLRPFNHYGPRQKEGFVIADFCAQIARAEKGKAEAVIQVGNLNARRDFLFVEDVVRAYALLAEALELQHNLYNLSTGETHSIQEILDTLLAMSAVNLRVEKDSSKYRPIEVPVLVASSELAYKDFGWKPENTLKAGLKKTLDWWRSII